MRQHLLARLSPPVSARAIRALALAFAACGAFGLLAGCDTVPESHVVSAPPPPAPTTTVMTTTTTTSPVAVGTPGASTIIVTQAPPTPQAEVVLAQPSSQYVWIAGYWTWNNSQYQWVAGHWELPPSSASAWVAPRWEHEGNAYRFYEGYWQ